MTVLTDYRTNLDNLLATAVDTSTWTTTMKDEALRQALVDYSRHGPIYETDFTVLSTGYSQDLSSITDLLKVEDLMWPWVAGDDWGKIQNARWTNTLRQTLTKYRPVGVNIFYFSQGQPTAGEIIRVRYRKSHKIQDLDSAVATTISDVHEYVLVLRAAALLIEQRLRQISENPAIPRDAVGVLQKLYASWMNEYLDRLDTTRHGQNPSWSGIGL
jgi:hypothetical protein